MSAGAMINGQMYRVQIHATVDDREEQELDYLIVATGEDDALSRVSYLIDLSEFRTWRCVRVEKQGRVHLIRAKVRNSDKVPADAILERRPDGVLGFFRQIDRRDAKKWVVHASTTCFAKNANMARDKLMRRIQTGHDLSIEVEEVGVNSGFAMPRDVSHLPRAHVLKPR